MPDNYRNGRTLRGRLFSRLVIDTETGCVLWTGSIHVSGYGRIGVDGQLRYTHRLMYEIFAGPIPESLTLDHLCRTRQCANVAHLEPVTRRENTLRGETIPARNAIKTHCTSGHEYDLINTYFYQGARRCRACDREAHRRLKPAPQIVSCARCGCDWPENDPGVRYAQGDFWCTYETECNDRLIGQADE